jgi:hypothetical protein
LPPKSRASQTRRAPSDETDAVRAGRPLDDLDRLVAEAPFGRVDDPLEGQIVVGGDGEPEVGHRVPDLEPFVKARPADHPVGQADGQEPVLEGTHLVAGPHKDRHAVQPEGGVAAGAALHRLDVVADPARLFLAVPVADEADLCAVLAVGEEGFAQPPLVGRDHAGGGRKDMPGGAIVLLEPDHRGAGEIRLEAQDIAHFGAAPAIDRLVVVAHTADVAVPPGQKPQPQVLGDVGVLIFVDEDIAEPAPVLVEHVVAGLEDHHHVQQQIAEIAGVQLAQAGLIGGVEVHAPPVIGPGLGRGDLVGGEGLVLPVVDDPGQHPRGPTFVVDILGGDELFEQPDLVVCVEDGEVRFQPHQLGMAAQQFHADRVEGAEPRHPLHRFAKELAQPRLHLAGGFVGEGDGEHLVRAGSAGGQKMRDPGGERTGLARPCARQHEDRAFERFNRGALRRVQPVEIGHWPGSHGLPRQRGVPGSGGGCGLEGVFVGNAAHGHQSSADARSGKALFAVCSQGPCR